MSYIIVICICLTLLFSSYLLHFAFAMSASNASLFYLLVFSPGQLSESEFEGEQKEVELAQDLSTRGCRKGQKTNIRLLSFFFVVNIVFIFVVKCYLSFKIFVYIKFLLG